MNSILQTFMAIAVVFVVAFGILTSVFIFKPEFLGLPPNLTTDTVQVQPTTMTLQISEYKTLVRQRDSLQKSAGKLADTAGKSQANYKAALNDIETLKRRLTAQDKEYMRKMDSLERFNWTLFAKIYDKAEPKEVAKILTELNEQDAAFILKTMKPKVAAKVLENMDPVAVATIMSLSRTQSLK